LDSNSDEDTAISQKGRITTNLTEKSRTELVKILKEQRKQIKYPQKKLAMAKTVQKQTKKQVHIEQDWTGEETNYANSITKFCKTFLFPRYTFLKEGGMNMTQIWVTAYCPWWKERWQYQRGQITKVPGRG
jgi:hypothetical protein